MNIEKLVDQCYNAIPSHWKQRPWAHLNHGIDVLDTEVKLNAYIAAYGEMHIVKCRMAMQNFPFEDLVLLRSERGDITKVKDFEIYDWGCGQGIASLVLLQMLRERDMLSGLCRVTLIEPSKCAISRAEKWVQQLANPSTDIRVINRYIPTNNQLKWNDINCNTSIAIHLCSNILDIREVGLKWLAKQTCNIAERSIFVCVGPQYGSGVSRISDFHHYLGSPYCFTDFSRYPCGYTSRTRHAFGIEAKCFVVESSANINTRYVEQSKQIHLDEYQSGDECLKGVLPDTVISAYHCVMDATDRTSFELYLRPSIGIERPDFIFASVSRGVLILNVCEDISNFGKEFDRVTAIKQALIDTYIKSLRTSTIVSPSTYNVIKVGLYFPEASQESINEQCAIYYNNIVQQYGANNQPINKPKDPTQFLIKLTKENCKAEIRAINCPPFRYDIFEEIKNLILGNWHSYSQGDTSLRLTNRQKELVENDSLRLRIKGVAGCGKTQIVAYKAVKEHIRTGTKVLIVTYNISLIRYIKMRINQVPADFSTDAFEIINYHQFFNSKARRYHGAHIPFNACDNSSFFEEYIDQIKANNDQYDTIIVDEAQDYNTAWFDCLRKYFLTEKGRMILCGDGDQNIFSRRVEASTKLPMVRGFGDNNPWRVVSNRLSMRIVNPEISVLASQFAQNFDISTDAINAQESFNLFEHKIRYWHTTSTVSPNRIAANIEGIIKEYALQPKDVVVLGLSINLLRDVDYCLRNDCSITTMTTFETKEDYEEIKSNVRSSSRLTLDLKSIRRVSKVHFTTDVDDLKLSTIQSFKGWESKNIILIIQSETDRTNENGESDYTLSTKFNMPAHIYTAITRARENLFIFNINNQVYHDFFKTRIHND